ncbi:hypothetical protein BC830DRAFT_490764 [Chytriomyces sp. MP71]|nr:hypothetical protein BC830DRAFT_490764 [Chytriomyces sp. MP71]
MDMGAAPPRVTRSAVQNSVAAKHASSGAVGMKGIGTLPRRALGEVAFVSANRHPHEPPAPGLKLKRASTEASEERLKRQRVSSDRLSKGVAVCAEPDLPNSSTTVSTTAKLKASIQSRQPQHQISSAQIAINARATVASRAKLNGTGASQLAAARNAAVNAYDLATVRANINAKTSSMALRSRNISTHTASRAAWNHNPVAVSSVQKSAIDILIQSASVAKKKPASVAPHPRSVLKPALKHSGTISKCNKDKHVAIKASVDGKLRCSTLPVAPCATQNMSIH